MNKLSWEQYFSQIANSTSERSSCSRRQVGAVLVRDRTIISTGYNGTPSGATNCDEGGCPRCSSDEPSYSGYSWCTCVHAEVNAVALAARQGIQTNGATLYCTLRPCLDCLKAVVQAGVREIIFARDFDLEDKVETAYRRILLETGTAYRYLPL